MRRLLKTQGTWQGRGTTRHRGMVLAAVLAFSLIGIALAVAGTIVIGPPGDRYRVDTSALQTLSLSVESQQSSVVANPVSSVNVGQIDPSFFPKICAYVDALDAGGFPIPNLPPDSFCVYQDSFRLGTFTFQEIRSDSCRVTVCLVIDVSGSMDDGNPKKITSAKSAASKFVRAMGLFDRTAIVKFSDCYTLVQNFTGDTTVLLNAINGLSANGKTAYFDGVWKGDSLTTTELGSKAVIALTDGMENNSENCGSASTPNGLPDGFANDSALIVNLALGAGIPIYNISLGSSFDPQYCIKLSNATGGTHYHAPSGTQLDSIYDAIRVRLCSRYLICYNSPDTIQNGDCHKVIVCRRNLDGSCSPCDTGQYCEKYPPKIRRTPPTIALDNVCQQPGTSVQLCAWATDQDTPLNQLTVNMFYRRSNALPFTSVATTRTDSTFCATVPANQLLCDGDSIQYYFTASDGSQTVATPSNAPVGHHAFPICPPNANAGPDKVLTCTTTQINLAGSTSTGGATFAWVASGGGHIVSGASTATPLVDAAGMYKLTVTNPANGCTAKDTALVTQNTTKPVLSCAGDELTCDSTLATASVSSTPSTGVTYLWTPAPSSGQGTAFARYSTSGSKKVVVTITATGCKDSCNATITQTVTKPVLSCSGDELTCDSTLATASVSSTPSTGVSYVWSPAPSSGQGTAFARYSTPGSKRVVVTITATGCKDSCDATITQTATKPVLSCSGDELTCDSTLATASVTSTPSTGVSYVWSPAPSSGQGTAFARYNSPGSKKVVVTITATGCKDSCNATIAQNITKPVLSCVGDTITCVNPEVTVSVTSNPSVGVSYLWSPAPLSGQGTANANYNTAGTKKVVVKILATGCKDSCNAVIVENLTKPVLTCSGDELTCDSLLATASVTSTPSTGVSYLWTPAPVSGQGTAFARYSTPGTKKVVVTIVPAPGKTECVTCKDSCNAVITQTVTKPVLSCSGDELTCDSTLATASVTSTPSTGVSYLWTPAPSSGQGTAFARYSTPGSKKVVVTITATGCKDSCNATITQTATKPVLSCSGDELTCDSTLATASVTSTPSTGVSYVWSPAPSSGQGTAFARYSTPGSKKVVVTITATGCKDSCDATITQTITKPVLSCSGDELTCDSTLATASVTSTPSTGVGYVWSPAPSSGQGTAFARYSTSGSKKVVVTITATGCKDSCNATITQTVTKPVLSCSGDELTCDSTLATASVTATPSTGVSYVWSPAPSSGQGTAFARYSTPGSKKVVVTITATGCKDSCDATITQTVTKPVLSCSGDELTCDSLLATASVTSTPSTGVSYVWSPAPSSGQGTAFARYSTPGSKKVVVTITATGCKDSCDATITQTVTKPVLSCSGDELTCDSTLATASVTSTPSTGLSYVWSPAPSSGQGTAFARYSTPGSKKVVVTITATGCKDSCDATITQDLTKPQLTCTGDTLTCDSTEATASVSNPINQSKIPSPLTFVWTPAPLSGQGTPFARYNTPGTKKVVVTYTPTGCKDSCEATIIQTITKPVLSCSGDELSCDSTLATASVTSTPSTGVSYLWSPAPSSGQGTAFARYSTPGSKRVVVTILTTGCKDSCDATITQTVTKPSLSCSGDELTCDSTLATASVTSTPSTGVSYVWSPAPSSGQGTAFARYSTPGTKKVVVTITATGCKDSCDATITQNITKPFLVCHDDTLTCDSLLATASVVFDDAAKSPVIADFGYFWSPSPVSGQGTPIARYDTPGQKKVVVTILATGCKDSCEATITQIITKPVLSCSGDELTCDSTLATASVTSTPSTGVSYVWSPAPSSGQGTAFARYSTPGTKKVVVTITATGCKDSCDATITQNITKPFLVCHDDTLTCDSLLATASVVLDDAAKSPVTAVLGYFWSPSPVSGQGTPIARYDTPGQKKVVVTILATGCKDSCEATITQIIAKPVLNCSGDELTCDSTLATASVTSTPSTGVSYVWSPAPSSGQGTAFARYSTPGSKRVVVTITATGCKDSCDATITQDITTPQLTCTGDELTCDSTLATASVSIGNDQSKIPVPWTFLWTPAPVSGQGTPFARYDTPGTKKVVVTITETGCKDSCEATITQSSTTPGLSCTGDTITCSVPLATVSVASSPSVGVSYAWSPAPLGGQGTPVAQYSSSGTKKVVVTLLATGCKDSCEAVVSQDISTPSLECSGDELSCDSLLATASVFSNPSTGVSYAWTPAPVSGQGTAFARYSTPGSKTVVVTITASGCRDSCHAVITQDVTPPSVDAGSGYVLNCLTRQVNLAGYSATPSAIFSWVASAGGHIISGAGTASPLVDSAGTYTLTVTDPANGCKASDIALVTFETIPGPECHLPNDTTIFQCSPSEVQLPVSATFHTQFPEIGSKRHQNDGYSRGKRTEQMGSVGSMAASANQQGCAIISGPGTLINGLWIYTPTGSGSVTVTVQCTDECGATCQGSFTVHFDINDPPTISLGGDISATLGDPPVCFTYTVSDPDGLAGLIESLVSFPAGTTIDTALNRICWTPSGAGVFLIVGKVEDPCLASDLDTMAISVFEPAPPICSIPNDTTVVRCAQTPLCLPVTATSLNPPVNCEITEGPGTLSGGQWCYTPTGNETVDVTIQCTDARGAICSGHFQVVFNMDNDAPVCHMPNDTTIFQCIPAPVRIPISASDPNNNLMRCKIMSGPGTLTTSGNWAYTPRGPDTVHVTIRCTDSCGLYCEESFTVAFAIDHLRPICKPTLDTTIHACPLVPIMIPIYADVVGLVDCYISGGPGDLVDGYWVFTPTTEEVVRATIRCHSVCNESWQWSLTIRIKLDGTNCGGETVSLGEQGTSGTQPSPTAAIVDPCNCPARGDINGDGVVSVSDLSLLTGLVFRKVPPPPLASGCSSIKQCDVNCDNVVDRRDVTALAAYAFDQGPQLCEPCKAKSSGTGDQPKR